MVRPLVVMLATALLAACTPLGGSLAPTQSPAPQTTVASADLRQPVSPSAFADCPVTKPVTNEGPKNPNTASFSLAWFVSPDRLLWASASDRFWAGRNGNKVLWERPGSTVSISGKLLTGDAKAAGVPTITGPQGYEGSDYQASGVTFPVPGCWEVEARAAGSILDFVALVYPPEYAPAGKSCVDLKGTFDNSDAVLQASALSVGEDLPDFVAVRFSPKVSYKAPIDFSGFVDLHIDLTQIARPRAGEGYTLFLARDGLGLWQIVCPFRTLATVDGGGAVHIAALRPGPPILANDVRDLDRELRALAR